MQKQGGDQDLRLAEAENLAHALDLDLVSSALLPLRRIHPGLYIGTGKANALKVTVAEQGVNVVIIDSALSPVQQRNLEKHINAKVIDRTGLILEIFSLRARSREGRLQVELARLSYERSRLVRTWTHLERQRGGRGFLAGPGERQIETDRRLLDQRMGALRRDLDKVRRTRQLHRTGRARKQIPTLALAGYTNAGKSTLFNALCGAGVFVEDMLFATLDTTMRTIILPGGREVILSDTVGFITDLPTELIAAFHATLEDVAEADLILHVRDIAAPQSAGQKQSVDSILTNIMSQRAAHVPVLEVWNKADLLSRDEANSVRNKMRSQTPEPALVSALEGVEGLTPLLHRIEDMLNAQAIQVRIKVPAEEGSVLPWICRHGHLVAQENHKTGAQTLVARLDQQALGAFTRLYPQLETGVSSK